MGEKRVCGAPPSVLDVRYELHSPLAYGGMATVWRATDRVLGRDVAVKTLGEPSAHDAETRQRFDREGRTAAGLSHPNIVAVHDVGRDGETPYLVMELVTGQPLSEVI